MKFHIKQYGNCRDEMCNFLVIDTDILLVDDDGICGYFPVKKVGETKRLFVDELINVEGFCLLELSGSQIFIEKEPCEDWGLIVGDIVMIFLFGFNSKNPIEVRQTIIDRYTKKTREYISKVFELNTEVLSGK